MGLVTIESQAFQDAADRVAGTALVGELAKAGPSLSDILGEFPTLSKPKKPKKQRPQRVTARRVQNRPNTTPGALVGERPAAPDVYKQAGILSPHEWATQAHPEWASRDRIPKAFHDQMQAEYQAYVERTLAVGELGRRRTKDQTSVDQAAMDRDLALDIETMRGERAGRRTGSGGVMDQLQAAALEELLTGQPGRAYEAYQRLKAPSVGVTPRAGRVLLEEVLGIEGFGGLQKAIQADPVKGWLQAYRRLTAFNYFANPQDAQAAENFLQGEQPTAEDVIEAHNRGRISDEEKVELLQILLTPEQQQELLAPKQPPVKPRRNDALVLPRGAFDG